MQNQAKKPLYMAVVTYPYCETRRVLCHNDPDPNQSDGWTLEPENQLIGKRIVSEHSRYAVFTSAEAKLQQIGGSDCWTLSIERFANQKSGVRSGR